MDQSKLKTLGQAIETAINPDSDSYHKIKVTLSKSGEGVYLNLVDTSTDLHGYHIDVDKANLAFVFAQTLGVDVEVNPRIEPIYEFPGARL